MWYWIFVGFVKQFVIFLFIDSLLGYLDSLVFQPAYLHEKIVKLYVYRLFISVFSSSSFFFFTMTPFFCTFWCSLISSVYITMFIHHNCSNLQCAHKGGLKQLQPWVLQRTSGSFTHRQMLMWGIQFWIIRFIYGCIAMSEYIIYCHLTWLAYIYLRIAPAAGPKGIMRFLHYKAFGVV